MAFTEERKEISESNWPPRRKPCKIGPLDGLLDIAKAIDVHVANRLKGGRDLMAHDDAYCMVFSTCPDADTARRIAGALVEQRLAACVNIVPGLQSIYLWQGRQETSEEHLLIIKTRNDRYPALEQAIQAAHPYELPEIVSVPINGGLPAYLSWIDSVVKGL